MSDTVLHRTCGYPIGDAVVSSLVGSELRESSWDCLNLQQKMLQSFEFLVNLD